MLNNLKVKLYIWKYRNKTTEGKIYTISKLEKIRCWRSVQALIQILEDDYFEIRIRAIQALEILRDVHAVEPLIRMLGDANEDVRIKSAEALGNLGDVRAIKPLILMRVDSNRFARESASESVRKLVNEKEVGLLIHVLLNGVGGFIGKASQVVTRWDSEGNPLTLGLYIRELVNSSLYGSPLLGGKSADELANFGNDRALGFLVWALGSGYYYSAVDTNISRKAADALGELGDREAIKFLIWALSNHENGLVRKAAAEALEKLGQVKWQKWILGDEQDLIRMGESDDLETVASLIIALEHKSILFRCKAAEALGYLGDTNAFEPLFKTLVNSSDKKLRRLVVEALLLLAKNPSPKMIEYWDDIKDEIWCFDNELQWPDIPPNTRY